MRIDVIYFPAWTIFAKVNHHIIRYRTVRLMVFGGFNNLEAFCQQKKKHFNITCPVSRKYLMIMFSNNDDNIYADYHRHKAIHCKLNEKHFYIYVNSLQRIQFPRLKKKQQQQHNNNDSIYWFYIFAPICMNDACTEVCDSHDTFTKIQFYWNRSMWLIEFDSFFFFFLFKLQFTHSLMQTEVDVIWYRVVGEILDRQVNSKVLNGRRFVFQWSAQQTNKK